MYAPGLKTKPISDVFDQSVQTLISVPVQFGHFWDLPTLTSTHFGGKPTGSLARRTLQLVGKPVVRILGFRSHVHPLKLGSKEK